MVHQDGKIHYSAGSPFFSLFLLLLTITRSDHIIIIIIIINNIINIIIIIIPWEFFTSALDDCLSPDF